MIERGTNTLPDGLLMRLKSRDDDEKQLHLQAWSMLTGQIPPDLAGLLQRDAYLESALGFASFWLQQELSYWRLTYTAFGGPFSAKIRVIPYAGVESMRESSSDGSATRALLAAILSVGL